ncbi:hypothetical protein [Azospirillum argentinense]
MKTKHPKSLNAMNTLIATNKLLKKTGIIFVNYLKWSEKMMKYVLSIAIIASMTHSAMAQDWFVSQGGGEKECIGLDRVTLDKLKKAGYKMEELAEDVYTLSNGKSTFALSKEKNGAKW